MIISHRGNDIYGFKENTQKAIISSLDSDYTDGVEFDVRITKDKKIVINHNSFVGDQIIKNNKSKNLKLDSLKSTLRKIKSNKLIIIEIKDNNLKVIDIVYKIIKKFPFLNIVIHSFHYDLLIEMKKRYPNLKIGLIIGNIINTQKNLDNIDFVSINYKKDLIKNKENFVWTVNKTKLFHQLKKQKINIITDKPYL